MKKIKNAIWLFLMLVTQLAIFKPANAFAHVQNVYQPMQLTNPEPTILFSSYRSKLSHLFHELHFSTNPSVVLNRYISFAKCEIRNQTGGEGPLFVFLDSLVYQIQNRVESKDLVGALDLVQDGFQKVGMLYE